MWICWRRKKVIKTKQHNKQRRQNDGKNRQKKRLERSHHLRKNKLKQAALYLLYSRKAYCFSGATQTRFRTAMSSSLLTPLETTKIHHGFYRVLNIPNTPQSIPITGRGTTTYKPNSKFVMRFGAMPRIVASTPTTPCEHILDIHFFLRSRMPQ